MSSGILESTQAFFTKLFSRGKSAGMRMGFIPCGMYSDSCSWGKASPHNDIRPAHPWPNTDSPRSAPNHFQELISFDQTR
jgi:hypothetical protein